MTVAEAATLDLPPRYRARLVALLRAHVPRAEVWAYGSRVAGTAHAASDLDLVLRDPRDAERETPGLGPLREAFIESDLPIRVDVADWACLPPRFRREIERLHVVVQAAD